MTKVQKNRIRKWVEALRSGKFKQGKGQLFDGECYCCLGVGCELYRRATRKGQWIDIGDGRRAFVDGTNAPRSWSSLPLAVSKWFGVDDHNPVLIERGGWDAIELNDAGKRFSTIAKLIEKKYLSEAA